MGEWGFEKFCLYYILCEICDLYSFLVFDPAVLMRRMRARSCDSRGTHGGRGSGQLRLLHVLLLLLLRIVPVALPLYSLLAPRVAPALLSCHEVRDEAVRLMLQTFDCLRGGTCIVAPRPPSAPHTS